MISFTPHAIEAVKTAGTKLLQLLTHEIQYQFKNSHDILAEGDLLSEQTILNAIKDKFPDHAFFSEEAGKSGHSEYVWVLDPIDGTINFARGLDEFCISLALVHKHIPILGIIYQPSLNKLYVAEKNKGAYLNDKKITVSQEQTLVNTLLATDNTSNLQIRQENFALLQKISPAARQVRIYGAGTFHLSRIAEGKLDAYFKTSMHYWDFGAGILLVEEAGGKVTDFENKPFNENSKNIVVTNGILHNELIELIHRNQ